ncbi:MAG: PQQ-binding-like beta-propeller repeat protein [Verrucomicrobiaceae bacterium]|nr:PQQ-binding-like beta-propeller repeat protein [Verrucomicrobiaceae bacterium]
MRLHLLTALLVLPAAAADWPSYRCDSARSGYTAEAIPNELRQRWEFRLDSPPRPAWPTSDRIEYDLGIQPIIVSDLVLFGSSADDQVYALEAGSGRLRWRFSTGGPVRFAPVAWKDRIFVVSDDGFLYAIELKTGALLWKHRPTEDNRMVLGNDRMISRWPARGGPVVADDTVYYCAGIWPSDGVHVCALDAQSGKEVWKNSETGGLMMAQPHGGAEAASGVAPQGYLLADKTGLLVPTGRAVPAMFNRNDGTLRYYHLQKNGQRGGTRAVITESWFINADCLFDIESGNMGVQFEPGIVVATPTGVVRADGRSLITYKWKEVSPGVRGLQQDRSAPVEKEITDFIIAGSEAIVGGDGQISAIDYNGQRTEWWKHDVEGKVRGLAAANGHVVATTDAGVVYLFNADPSPLPQPAPKVARTASKADCGQLLKAYGQSEGYAVVFDDTELALSLAEKSALQVIAIGSLESRERLIASGRYGSQISLHTDSAGFPKQFANLVVGPKNRHSEMQRLQRPFGGVVCEVSGAGELRVSRSAAQKGVGNWTHQNSNAANTLCSDDEVVKGRLSMFWFRDVDFEVPNRHGQGPAPLIDQGCMVVGGVNGLYCMDSYNGRKLWQREVKKFLIDFDGIHHDVGVGDTGGPFCIGGDSVYVKTEEKCQRLELTTGRVIHEFKTPVQPDAVDRHWGYLAFEDGLLFGSVESQGHNVSARYGLTGLRTESCKFFALDPQTKAVKWEYQPRGSIRHNAIAIAAGRVYLIDRPWIDADRTKEFSRSGRKAERLDHKDVPNGTLLCLDAKTGKVIWKNDEDIWGTQLAVSAKHGVLLMNYKAVRHNFFEIPSESGGRLAGLDITTGKRLWDMDAKYQTRPLINDGTVYAQGGAWDLKSGSPLPFELERSYGCGQISGSKNLMLFRSGTLGYVDLTRKAGTENYGGMRPSCWINAIPASGLVLVPDGSSKCHCSYQMRAWFALQGE